MGFLRRLFGGSQPTRVTVVLEGAGGHESRWTPPPPWRMPPVISPHPNAPKVNLSAEERANERNLFTVPDGIVFLNTKTRAAYNTVRLTGTRSQERQKLLASLMGKKLMSTLRVVRNPDGVVTGIDVVYQDEVLGALPEEAIPVFAPILNEFEARGWRVVTRTEALMPENSIVAIDDSQRRGQLILAETGLPVEGHDELFADAYDASFWFSRSEVFGPKGKPHHQPSSPVAARPRMKVRCGEAEADADLVAWKRVGSDVEGRGLNFLDPRGTWITGDGLPAALAAAGCVVTNVAGVTHHRGIASSSIAVGQPIRLRPEPSNPHDRNAVAVWTADGSEQIGYLPRELAAMTMAEARRRQLAFSGAVLWEFRDAGSSARCGLRLLIGPSNVVVQLSATGGSHGLSPEASARGMTQADAP